MSFFFLLSCFAPVLTFSVFSSNSMAYDPRQNSLFHHLNFYLNFIAEYKILHSFFRFRIIGKRFTLVYYFLNSTLLFDRARRIFSTRFIKLHLPSHISNSTLKIFNTTSEFSFTLQWSLIKTICRWVGRGWLFRQSCFAPFVQTLRQPSHLLLYKKLWSV